MQSGIHPDWGLAEYEHWLRVVKDVAPEMHLHAYAAMEVDHMCKTSDLPPREVFEPARGGPRLDPGTHVSAPRWRA